MALKTKQIRKQPQAERATRKSKFQADLAPAEDRMVRGLKQELQLTSNSDFLSDALALFRWAVWERKRSEEHTSELQSRLHLVCRLLLEKKKEKKIHLDTLLLKI